MRAIVWFRQHLMIQTFALIVMELYQRNKNKDLGSAPEDIHFPVSSLYNNYELVLSEILQIQAVLTIKQK